MTAPGDREARLRALTDLGSSLVVEAGAGTGKTSLLTGRIALLLADGVAPAEIVAITFTEQAAGELAGRIRGLVETLLGDEVPEVLRDALPCGLTPDRRANLAAAAAEFDELTTSTIHGFCHSLIRDHAIAAGVDPGAEVMDAEAADEAFDAVFDRWLERRLDGGRDTADSVVTVSLSDPRGAAELLRSLARFRRRHPSAATPPGDLSGRPDLDLAAAVARFRDWCAEAPPHAETVAMARSLDELDAFYAGAFASPPDFADLWRLAHPPRVASMRWNSFELSPLRDEAGWRGIAGDADGTRLFEQASGLCLEAIERFSTLLGRVAGVLTSALSVELDEVLADYRGAKRCAARMDFEDLLETARALVRDHAPVREAAAARCRRLLVDEFQDTDPVQAEIVFRLTAREPAASWLDCVPREGALFVVGDPKQSIYRFRGADAAVYLDARRAILAHWPGNLVEITSNWRSRPGVCAHVNRCFAQPLSRPLQPGYAAMTAMRDDPSHDGPCACRLPLDLQPDANAATVREVEAEAVATVCARLVGAMRIEDRDDGAERALTAGDVALLAPVGTDLWRYERALRRHGLRVASQAGKAFHRRQEVQDLAALTRVLAGSRDTLAFGALLRGPMVGATDESLLDVAERLHGLHGEDPRSRFTVATAPDEIGDAGLARIVSILQRLRRKAGSTAPHALLSEALAALDARTIVAGRDAHGAEGALANLDCFLEMSRGYAVRGLRRFAQDLDRAWRTRSKRTEGRVDAAGDAVTIVTMHAAKGLEWAVTIPINAGSRLSRRADFFHREADDTLHWMLGEVVPPSLAQVLREADQAEARENERLWYVAATRARELVILPEIGCAALRSWARAVDLRHAHLPEFDGGWLRLSADPPRMPPPNLQDPVAYAAQSARIAAATPVFRWLRPSDGDPDRRPDVEDAELDGGGAADDPAAVAGGGRVRGLVLHKLLEELLTGELAETPEAVLGRAADLLAQLADGTGAELLPGVSELTRTCLATLTLPAVVAARPRMIAECAVRYAFSSDGARRLVDGRADAVQLGPGRVEAVFDWKSAVDPSPVEIAAHRGQMRIYLAATGAPRGLVVYVTSGRVDLVEAPCPADAKPSEARS